MEFRKWELLQDLQEAEREMSFYGEKADILQKDLEEALRMKRYWLEVVEEIYDEIIELEEEEDV